MRKASACFGDEQSGGGKLLGLLTQSVGSCFQTSVSLLGELVLDPDAGSCVGHICLGGAQSRGRDLPLTSPGPSFPLPTWRSNNTLRENQRCGHL